MDLVWVCDFLGSFVRHGSSYCLRIGNKTLFKGGIY